MKCDICGAKIEETFLKKIVGTYVRDSKGKRKAVCAECQRKLKGKEELLAALSYDPVFLPPDDSADEGRQAEKDLLLCARRGIIEILLVYLIEHMFKELRMI